MKTIIVATDFSPVADNAAQYAASLAVHTGAKLLLYHAYHVPVPVTEAPVLIVTPGELQTENLNAIEQLAAKLKVAHPTLQINVNVSPGFAVQEINELAKTTQAQLIVMGISGTGKISEQLIGSTSTDLVKKSSCPVLIVPSESRFKKPEHFVLACDFRHQENPETITLLLEYVKLFNGKISVVNVVNPQEVPTVDKAVAGIQMENMLRGVPHTLYFPEAENVEEGIHQFINAHQADVLVTIPHKHSLFERLFHKRVTKKLAFHSHIPVLALHT